MKKSYFDSGGNDTELIAVLNAIFHVSARMARNMTILAQQRQSEKGERRYEQNERYLYVTAGLGGLVPFRLNMPNEITVITLHTKK